MKILFIGAGGINAQLRVKALRALGHEVDVLVYDQLTPFRELTLTRALRLRAPDLVDRYVLRHLRRNPALGERYEVALLNQPKILGPRCYRLLRTRCDRLLNYVNDDPFGHADVPYWTLFLRALPLNDLVAVSRDVNVPEAEALGARRVLRVPFVADEELHRPVELGPAERERWASEVLFVGTCQPERGPFMRELVRAGVPLAIHGSGWSEVAGRYGLRAHVRGGPLYGEDYVRAIRAAKVGLGLLSKDNRDECTRRSMEIPAIGTALCAERTAEHRKLYEEGREAVFFDDARECAELCLALLADPPRREAIAAAGHARFLRNGATNRAMLQQILAASDA